MQADAVYKTHEVVHVCAVESGAGWFGVFFDVDIPFGDGAVRVNIVTKEIGLMVDVFLGDFKGASGRLESFGAARNFGDADQMAASVKIGALLGEVEHDGWFSCDSVVVPVGNRVLFHRAAGQAFGRAEAVLIAAGVGISREVGHAGIVAVSDAAGQASCGDAGQKYKLYRLGK